MTRTQRIEKRANEAVARCLTRELDLPNVYFDAPWPDPSSRVDVLMVDRAGTGDVHVIEVIGGPLDIRQKVKEVMSVPAQFRWLASTRRHLPISLAWGKAKKAPAFLYAEDDMGRVGIIEIIKMSGDELGAKIVFRAERFRGNYNQLVDLFAAKHAADIEFR